MNRITTLFQIRYPVVQGGMIWCSGWRLAAAVSNAGGLGLIGSGSMYPEVLEEHLRRCKDATDKPFGVNLPLLYPDVEEHLSLILKHGVKIVFTSAGNPAKYTAMLKSHGITVAHVVANTRSARKCFEAGVDAIVAEGFEAGGHNGKEESTTMVLIPMIREVTTLPLIAAGGIANGKAMLAAFALGAEGVQIGTLFAAAEESSAHPAFKQQIVDAGEGDTVLTLKKLIPVRLIRNAFTKDILSLEEQGASAGQLQERLGRGRAKRGMFEGDTEQGELEIGQVSALIRAVKPVREIMTDLITEYNAASIQVQNIHL